MESLQEQFEGETEKTSLKKFQHEIEAFSIQEEDGNDIKSGHFLTEGIGERKIDPNFHASDLTEEDEEIWNKIKDETVTMDEIKAYQRSVMSLDIHDNSRNSRIIFMAYVGNKAMPAIFKQSLPDREKNKK